MTDFMTLVGIIVAGYFGLVILILLFFSIAKKKEPKP